MAGKGGQVLTWLYMAGNTHPVPACVRMARTEWTEAMGKAVKVPNGYTLPCVIAMDFQYEFSGGYKDIGKFQGWQDVPCLEDGKALGELPLERRAMEGTRKWIRGSEWSQMKAREKGCSWHDPCWGSHVC